VILLSTFVANWEKRDLGAIEVLNGSRLHHKGRLLR
jgi:hypothetical protein